MAKLTRKSILVVADKKVVMADILKDIIYISADQFNSFFKSIGLTIPRAIRIASLKTVLKAPVERTRQERQSLADEVTYRLSWFQEFSETQLEFLLTFFNDAAVEKEYYETLWLEILSYMISKGVAEEHFLELFSLANIAVADNSVLENARDFNQKTKSNIFDQNGRIDGLTPKIFRPVMYKSATLTELREVGIKYDINVPKRLKKNEVAEIVIKELVDREICTDELAEEIRKMPVVSLQRFAKDNEIKVSTDLRKEEVIEYILANATSTKEQYFVPSSQSAYEMEVEETQQAKEEEDLTFEPVVEEVIEHTIAIEEVEEEPVVAPIIEPIIEEELVVAPIIEPIVEEEVIYEAPVVRDFIDDDDEPVVAPVVEEKIVEPVVAPAPTIVQSVANEELLSELRLLRQAVEDQIKVQLLNSLEPQNKTSLSTAPQNENRLATGVQSMPNQMAPNQQGLMAVGYYSNQQGLYAIPQSQGLTFIDPAQMYQQQQPLEEAEPVEKKPIEVKIFLNIVFFLLWLLIISIIFIVVYVIFTQYVGPAEFEGFDDVLNVIKIGDKGIITHLREFFGGLAGQ